MAIDDVNLADNIFGPNIRALKGKSTRSKPKPVQYDVVETPTKLSEQYKDLTHHMNVMFVNDIPVLTGIYRNTRYLSLV